MKLVARVLLAFCLIFGIGLMIAALFLPSWAQAQTGSPKVLEIKDTHSGTSRILDVNTNAKGFCIVFLDEKARIKSVAYRGRMQTPHCFSFQGKQRLIFDQVDPSYSFMAGETP